MKDSNAKDMKEKTEEVTNPELLFCDDALVVDYLNALLASEPALNMDFKEIHFVHNPARNGWKSAGITNSDTGNAIMLESDFLELQAEELRNENQNLKFKTELATIDAQVLRNENNNLKTEIKELAAQLNEIQSKLHTTLAHNDELRSTVEENLRQLAALTTQLQNTQIETVPDSEIVTPAGIDSDSEQITSSEVDESWIETNEEPETDDPPQSNTSSCEVSQDTPSDDVIMPHDTCKDETICPPVDRDRSFLTQLSPVTVEEIRKKKFGTAIFSQNHATHTVSRQVVHMTSKVIKHSTIESFHENRQAAPVSEFPSATPEKTGIDDVITMQRGNYFQEQPVVEEVEVKSEDITDASKITLPVDNSDEIDLEPIQPTKVIIRRNIKNYVDLQKESETTKEVDLGHTIVL